MARKPKEIRTAIIREGEGWFRTHGEAIFLRKTLWKFILMLVVLGVSTVALEWQVSSRVPFYLGCSMLGLVYFWYVVLMHRSGRIYWESIKDKGEPIELAPLPTWLGKKREVA